MATLYEMTEAAKTLYAMLDNEEIDEQVVNDTLEGMEVDKKLEDYCFVIREFENDVVKFKTEYERMKAKADSAKKNIERLKSRMLNYFEATGKKKETIGLFTVATRESKAVNIIDENLIPSQYFEQQKPKLLKREILNDLKSGEEIPGAEIQINHSVQIK